MTREMHEKIVRDILENCSREEAIRRIAEALAARDAAKKMGN